MQSKILDRLPHGVVIADKEGINYLNQDARNIFNIRNSCTKNEDFSNERLESCDNDDVDNDSGDTNFKE